MRATNLSTLLALAYAVTLSLATPITSGSLLPLVFRHTQSRCANYPDTIAGTWVIDPSQASCVVKNNERLTFGTFSNLNARSSSSNKLTPRRSTNTILWCAKASSTYIILTPGDAIAGHIVSDILSDAFGALTRHLDSLGDGPIPGGSLIWKSIYGISLVATNSNNHQQTYGVLAAALSALTDYMSTKFFGTATFWIFDGTNEVGKGAITSG